MWRSCSDPACAGFDRPAMIDLRRPPSREGKRRAHCKRHKTSIGEVAMRDCKGVAALAALLVMGTAVAAYAEMAISANDTKVKLVNGKQEVQKSPPPDNLTFIDLKSSPPKVLAEIDVPNSLVGPPTNVAISPKEDIALIASAMMIDPADPTKQIPDDRLTVIDLSPLKPTLVGRLKSVVGAKAGPTAPRVIATLQAGKGASGVS